VKIQVKIEKSIFQIRYKPVLSFYDKLYSKDKIFNQFPHWQTDRLKISLRDYDKKHSLVLKHDSLTYETDNYVKKNEEEIINLIHDSINEISSEDKITRLGHRFLCLAPLKISFNELVTILNLKLFKKDFFKILNQDPDDSTVTITSNYKDLKYRMVIGPMKNVEVPGFIIYNIENHVDPNSNKKYSELSNLVENYPETSLYIDIDLFTQETIKSPDILQFYNKTKEAYSYLTKELIGYIFEEKLA
jgi:hypothetical protein